MPFTKTIPTNAAATIADGTVRVSGPDGTPDKIAPGGVITPKLIPPWLAAGKTLEDGQAYISHHVGHGPTFRGVIEFSIATLAGVAVSGAELHVGSCGNSAHPMKAQWPREDMQPVGVRAQPKLYGYQGDGAITLADYGRLDALIGEFGGPNATGRAVDRTIVPANVQVRPTPDDMAVSFNGPPEFIITSVTLPADQWGTANTGGPDGRHPRVVNPHWAVYITDVTTFLQNAIAAGWQYVGFVIAQTVAFPMGGGVACYGAYLRVTADADFAVPAALNAPAVT